MTEAATAQAPKLTFREEGHTYFLDGVEIPGVTKTIEAAGMVDGSWFTEESKLRGTAVHLACQYDDEGALDEETLDPAFTPYLQAWRKFRSEVGFKADAIECRRHHPTLRYAGTIDRVGAILANSKKPQRVIVDIKSGALAPWHKIQLAAYAGLLEEPHAYARLIVALKPDGKYSLHECPLRDLAADLGLFQSALAVTNFRRKEGLL